ncbi:branched-chain amino acid transaminase [Pseudomonadota bacterium]
MQKIDAKIWMDGKFVSWNNAKIHILTHALHYGSGVFEGIRFYETDKGPAIFRLKDHIDRLFYSASKISMKIPYSKAVIIKTIKELIKINNLKDGYIRPLIFYGDKMGLSPRDCEVRVAIAAWPWPSYLGDKPVKACISNIMKLHPKSGYPDAKICGNYANSILAKLDAQDRGFDEGILIDWQGNVAEGPVENLFIVKDNVLITPKPDSILAGFTRDSVLQIASHLKIKTKSTNLKKKDLYEADEAFFCGTAAEITPIALIDKKQIGEKGIGIVTSELKERYLDAVHGRIPKFNKWLSTL